MARRPVGRFGGIGHVDADFLHGLHDGRIDLLRRRASGGSNVHATLGMLREESGGHYEIGLEESGDYTIFVGSTTGKSVQFTLKVGVTRLADI